MAHGDELESRAAEIAYAGRMAQFFKSWIGNHFGRELDVRFDAMTVSRTGMLARPGVHTLLQDHKTRDESTWHFYLANFRPFWTDSMAEGYHSENMCMSMWRKPRGDGEHVGYLAEKNCTEVSYELSHELLRQAGRRDSVDVVNAAWSRHFSGELPFVAYGADHEKTDGSPEFLTIDASLL